MLQVHFRFNNYHDTVEWKTLNMHWETQCTNKDGPTLIQTLVTVKVGCMDLGTNYTNLRQNLALAGQLGVR